MEELIFQQASKELKRDMQDDIPEIKAYIDYVNKAAFNIFYYHIYKPYYNFNIEGINEKMKNEAKKVILQALQKQYL